MTALRGPVSGKASPTFLRGVIYPRLGASSRELLAGPGIGIDNAVLRLEGRKVLVSTTDPMSMIPAVGAKGSAWLSFHLIASDFTTSGFSPRYGIFDFNLPMRMTDSTFETYWRTLHEECRRLGVSIIAGHTGRYEGCDYTIIGGGVMMSACPRNRYLTSAMAKEGDDIVLTKGAAIETTAILTRSFPRRVRRILGQRLFQKAWDYLRKVSTVEDSLSAASVGLRERGVTAMHDATEGGVISALLELAEASQLGLKLEVDQIQISSETAEVCKLFHADPFTSLSEGSLVIASRPFATSKVLKRLASKGLTSSVVGRLVSRNVGFYANSAKGTFRLHHPGEDPYWKAYSRAIARNWN